MKKIDRDKFNQTYGLFKFQIPTIQEQISALYLIGESTLFKKIILTNFQKFYDNLDAPKYGDWLMMHKEYGQTFKEFINGNVIPVSKERDVIYLTPLSCSDIDIDQSFVNALLIICQAYFYGMKVKLLNKKIDLNNYSIEIKIYDETKIQLNSNQIIEVLSNELPSDAYCLIGFTDKDLFNDENVLKPRNYIYKSNKKINSFCYGLSSLRNRVSVFTFARYDPLFYTKMVKKDTVKEQEKLLKYYFVLLKRACKVIINDILHIFGLKNCIFFSCILNGFNSMEEFDNRPFEICPICLRKLYTVISLKGFNDLSNARINNPELLYQRFIKIRDCLIENFSGMFDYEISWYNARIDSIDKEM